MVVSRKTELSFQLLVNELCETRRGDLNAQAESFWVLAPPAHVAQATGYLFRGG